MGSREEAERLQIVVIQKDRLISLLQQENADLKKKATKRIRKVKKLEKETTDADPLYTRGYTRADGVYVKPYRKKN